MSDDPVAKFKALKAELRRDGLTPELLARAQAATDKVRARSMEELIEASSFGTPGAKALRARTPPEVVDEILRRVDDT